MKALDGCVAFIDFALFAKMVTSMEKLMQLSEWSPSYLVSIEDFVDNREVSSVNQCPHPVTPKDLPILHRKACPYGSNLADILIRIKGAVPPGRNIDRKIRYSPSWRLHS